MYTNKNEEYLDFLTYVLIHAASADNEIGPSEEKMIKDRATAGEYKEVMAEYKKHTASQRTDYLQRMSDKWLNTDESKSKMVEQVQKLTGVDLVVNDKEKATYAELKNLLLS